MQRFLPVPDLTLLIDIDPALAVDRKPAGRDSYERDLALLQRVRDSYLQQGEQPGWVRCVRPLRGVGHRLWGIPGTRCPLADRHAAFSAGAGSHALIDIDPALAVDRKPAGRDSYERDLALLQRVRDSYLQQGEQPGWVRVDGDRPKQEIADEIITIVGARLAPA